MVSGLHVTEPNQTIPVNTKIGFSYLANVVWFGVSLRDITLYTQKQHIVMVTGLHVTETPNQKKSVNMKIGFSCLQKLFGLVFHCATTPCTPKCNTWLWLQGYMLLNETTPFL
jgi:hypothetical protein